MMSGLVNNVMKRIFINLFKKKDGYSGLMSLWYVVIFIIGIFGVMAFSEIVSRAFLLNETQSIMDTSGVAALRMGLDDEALRVEKFDVDGTVVEKEYRRMVSEALDDYGALVDYRFVRTETEYFKENWGLGVTNKPREQFLLDSTILLVVDTYTPLDVYPTLQRTYFNSRENQDFSIKYMGQNEDGRAEIMVRSVTRIVYR